MSNFTQAYQHISHVVMDLFHNLNMFHCNNIDATFFVLYALYQAKSKSPNVDMQLMPELNKHFSYVLDSRRLGRIDYFIDKAVKDFISIESESFLTVYPEIIEFVFQRNVGITSWGEITQPIELTKLVTEFLHRKDIASIYNPFAGTGSYALGFDGIYYGQEINEITYLFGLIRLDAHGKFSKNYVLEDSIKSWKNHDVDCIVSTPPFGTRMDPKSGIGVSTYEEFTLKKFLRSKANYEICIVTRGFCFSTSRTALNLRKDICNQNWLEMVINLPSGIFTNSGVSTSLIVLNKKRSKTDDILFVDAEKLFLIRNRKERILNVNEIIGALDSAESDIVHRIKIEELQSNDCSFDVTRYESQKLVAKEGQEIVPLSELLTQDKGIKLSLVGENIKNVIEASNFVNNVAYFNDVNNEFFVTQPKVCFEGPHIAFNLQGKVYVHKGTNRFYLGSVLANSVFRINEERVDIEYIAYKLIEGGLLEKFIESTTIPRFNTKRFLSYKLVIDVDKKKQRRIVADEKKAFLKRERERLGIREAGGDLTHMIGMPKDSIGNMLDVLLASDTLSDENKVMVKVIEDNFRYMLRLINTVGVDFETMPTPLDEINISEVVKNYAQSLKNLKFSNCYSIIENISVPEDLKIICGEDMIRIILDTALRNAYSHGFEQKYLETNMVKLECKAVSYNNKPFVCLSIANNGNPMPTDFSLNDYIVRGKKAGKMGNTGKGGYHIYSIAKKYNGYINISSSKEWSFILDILLPISKINNVKFIEEYGSKCL